MFRDANPTVPVLVALALVAPGAAMAQEPGVTFDDGPANKEYEIPLAQARESAGQDEPASGTGTSRQGSGGGSKTTSPSTGAPAPAPAPAPTDDPAPAAADDAAGTSGGADTGGGKTGGDGKQGEATPDKATGAADTPVTTTETTPVPGDETPVERALSVRDEESGSGASGPVAVAGVTLVAILVGVAAGILLRRRGKSPS